MTDNLARCGLHQAAAPHRNVPSTLAGALLAGVLTLTCPVCSSGTSCTVGAGRRPTRPLGCAFHHVPPAPGIVTAVATQLSQQRATRTFAAAQGRRGLCALGPARAAQTMHGLQMRGGGGAAGEADAFGPTASGRTARTSADMPRQIKTPSQSGAVYKAKQSLGQNFLVDQGMARKMVSWLCARTVRVCRLPTNVHCAR